jgi:chorismate dehydratase
VHALRVGIVDFLNSKPLAWGFLEGRHSDLFATSYHPPSRVADLLAAGELDIGLIPSIEMQRIPGLLLLPGLCIAATHEVRSVLLVARRPISELRRVALDVASRTSAGLLRILLAERYGIEPEYVPMRPPVESMLESCDAALVIGDPALAVDRSRYRILDLAGEWRELTGLPFVFAVWAVKPEVALRGLTTYFESSLGRGLAALSTLVRQSAAELGLEVAEVRSYLTESLSFALGEQEMAGLTEYWRRAHAHGLIGPPRPVELWREPAVAASGGTAAEASPPSPA